MLQPFILENQILIQYIFAVCVWGKKEKKKKAILDSAKFLHPTDK